MNQSGDSLLYHEYIGFQAARGLTPIDKGHLFRYVTPDVGGGSHYDARVGSLLFKTGVFDLI